MSSLNEDTGYSEAAREAAQAVMTDVRPCLIDSPSKKAHSGYVKAILANKDVPLPLLSKVKNRKLELMNYSFGHKNLVALSQ